jgi:hypothetical protein
MSMTRTRVTVTLILGLLPSILRKRIKSGMQSDLKSHQLLLVVICRYALADQSARFISGSAMMIYYY